MDEHKESQTQEIPELGDYYTGILRKAKNTKTISVKNGYSAVSLGVLTAWGYLRRVGKKDTHIAYSITALGRQALTKA